MEEESDAAAGVLLETAEIIIRSGIMDHECRAWNLFPVSELLSLFRCGLDRMLVPNAPAKRFRLR